MRSISVATGTSSRISRDAGSRSRRSITGDTAALVARAGIAGRSAIPWPTSARSPTARKAGGPGCYCAVLAAQATARAEAARLTVPLLILQGDADRIVDPAGAAEVATRITCPHELVTLLGYYHELLNEPEEERARVLALLDRWFDRWLAP